MVLCFCGISCYFSLVTSYFVYLGPPSFFLGKSGYKFVNFVYLFIKPALGFIVSQAGECIKVARTIRAGLTVLLLHFGYCTLLWASEALFLSRWSPPGEGAGQGEGNFLLSQLPLRGAGPVPIPLLFFFNPTWLCGNFSCNFGFMILSASIQQIFCDNCTTCRCIFDILGWPKC